MIDSWRILKESDRGGDDHIEFCNEAAASKPQTRAAGTLAGTGRRIFGEISRDGRIARWCTYRDARRRWCSLVNIDAYTGCKVVHHAWERQKA
jgi:hypothetical protein